MIAPKYPFAPAALSFGLMLLLSVPGAAADKPAADSAKPAYPLTTCIVSDEKLGSMGKAIQYVHHEVGKPDRTVLLCCKTCIDDFKENPSKYLAKLDRAAAAPAAKK